MLSYRDLLSKIYEDEKIEFVLESLGCHSIHTEQGGSLIVSARPTGDNKRSVQVKNDYTLSSKIRSLGVSGDLYDVVREIMGFEYVSQCKDYLMTVCGYDENTSYEEPPLMWLNRLKRQRARYDIDFSMEEIDESVLNQYIYSEINQFINDGISKEALVHFKIGYDVISKRITIPVYDKDGVLCGVKARATNKEDAERYKFLYLYKCDQRKTLYNYHNVKDIDDLREVKVFESEKSPMQMYDMDIHDCVGIGSSNISEEQLQLLMNLNCDIVLCFDEGLDLENVTKPFFEFFKGKRDVYVVFADEETPSHASPSDGGIEMWNRLYKNRAKICEGE